MTIPMEGTSKVYDEITKASEEGLVGAAIVSPDVAKEGGISDFHFFNQHLGHIWRCILERLDNNRTIGELELGDDLVKRYPDLGLSYITGLTLSPITTSSSASHADIVRRAYIRRKLMLIGQHLIDESMFGTDPYELISLTTESLEHYYSDTSAERTSLCDDLRTEYQEQQQGISEPCGLDTGLGIEKYVPGGVPRDKMTLLFAETGHFKSTTALNMARGFASTGLGKVLFFSFEDNSTMVRKRIYAQLSGVPYAALITGKLTDEQRDQLASIDKEQVRALENVIVIDDAPTNMDAIIRISRQYLPKGLIAVFVDYIQKLETFKYWGPEADKAENAAKRDNVAWVLLSQINEERISDTRRSDRRPRLKDTLGSSHLRSSCKLGISIYRPATYGAPKTGLDKHMYAELDQPGNSTYSNVIELIIRKNILGVPDEIAHVLCDRPTGLMTPYEIPDGKNI
jgi:replicative DNA helicase